ncbi:hypothetical protein HYT26_03340 [Candidatus Pacearchaeota archaeon]|nr:hypothetical protein [Candidatus Pacearchaeota archaeon]
MFKKIKKEIIYYLLFALFFGSCFLGILAAVLFGVNLSMKLEDKGGGGIFIAFGYVSVFIVVFLIFFVFPKLKWWKYLEKSYEEE